MRGLVVADHAAVGEALCQILEHSEHGPSRWELLPSTRGPEQLVPALRGGAPSVRCVVLYCCYPEMALSWLHDLRCIASYRRSCILVSRTIIRPSRWESLDMLFGPPFSRFQVWVGLFPLKGILDALAETRVASYYLHTQVKRRISLLLSRPTHS